MAQAEVAYAAKIDPEVWKALAAAPDGVAEAIVYLEAQADLSFAEDIDDGSARGWAVYNALRATAEGSQGPVLAALDQDRLTGHVQSYRDFWIVDAVVVRADRDGLLDVAALPEVERVLPPLKLEPPQALAGEPEGEPDTVEWNIARIQADDVWATYGVTGTGAVVANVDTGVEYTHPALVNQYRGNLGGGVFDHNYNWFDPFASPAPYPAEGEHGTHTMGTMVGWDGGANQIGVAPGAKWIAAYGCCPSTEALLAAEQWIVAPTQLNGYAPRPDMRPHVNNNSWGGTGGRLIYEKVYSAQRAAGIFVAGSAGNSGPNCGTLGSPNDSLSALNTGATTSNDAIASFSSRGPSPFTTDPSPYYSAPGVNVRSSVPPNGYASLSGTSMAAPHAAGAAALLISLEPDLAWRPGEIAELLSKTADPMTSAQTCGGVPGSQVPNNTFGWGRINVKAAADMVYHAGWLRGTVLGNGVPLSRTLITLTNQAYTYTLEVHTGAGGQYRALVGAGAWDVTANAYGFTPAAVNGVVVVQDGTTIQNFNLSPLPVYTVSGTVSDAATTAGIPAYLQLAGDTLADPVWAAANGAYAMILPQGTYSLTVSHPGYQPYANQLVVSGNQTLNIPLTARTNYTCLDSRDPGGPVYSWVEASDGTPHNMGDDSYVTISLPAAFTYFGTSYTSMYVSSNGFIGFGAPAASAGALIPFVGAPNSDVLGFNDDLNPANGTQGVIYDKDLGAQKIVQWQAVQHWASGNPETFEVILDTASGSIVWQYKQLSMPDYASSGLEDSTGTVGLLWNYMNSAPLADLLAVRYAPATGNGVNWGCDHALWLSYNPDVSVAAAGTPVNLNAQGQVLGQYGAPGVVITATVPASTTVIELSPGGVLNGNIATWTIGDTQALATAAARMKISINAGVPGGTVLTSVARISDASGQWHEDTATVIVAGGPTAVETSSVQAYGGLSFGWLAIPLLAALLALAVWRVRRATSAS